MGQIISPLEAMVLCRSGQEWTPNQRILGYDTGAQMTQIRGNILSMRNY